MLAAGVDSPLRYGYGATRDFLLGVEFVTGDGLISKSGGRVVKNVTGYDLHKLFVGSLGTLGIITRLNLRTFPHPPRRRMFAIAFDAAPRAFEDLALACKLSAGSKGAGGFRCGNGGPFPIARDRFPAEWLLARRYRGGWPRIRARASPARYSRRSLERPVPPDLFRSRNPSEKSSSLASLNFSPSRFTQIVPP